MKINSPAWSFRRRERRQKDQGKFAQRAAELLRAAGVPAHEITEAGLVHGYLRARGMSARAAESFERILLAIEALGQGIWPYD